MYSKICDVVIYVNAHEDNGTFIGKDGTLTRYKNYLMKSQGFEQGHRMTRPLLERLIRESYLTVSGEPILCTQNGLYYTPVILSPVAYKHQRECATCWRLRNARS